MGEKSRIFVTFLTGRLELLGDQENQLQRWTISTMAQLVLHMADTKLLIVFFESVVILSQLADVKVMAI